MAQTSTGSPSSNGRRFLDPGEHPEAPVRLGKLFSLISALTRFVRPRALRICTVRAK
jgi:hypothetical protein